MKTTLLRFLKKSNSSLYLFFLYSILFAVISYLHIQKIGAFGCFDDCNNFLGGYFLLKDKQIFSEFFFNHAPLMAHISFFIQRLSSPDSLYSLVLNHRLFLIGFSYIFSLFLIFRFKFIAFIFLIIFEFTKYYIFGDRFLAESFIIYPIIYLFGLFLFSLNKNQLKPIELFFSGILMWFIIFMREPFIPLVLFLIGCFFILVKRKIIYLLFPFIAISALTLLFLPGKDLIENVFLLNSHITSTEIASKGGITTVLLISFFYPLYIFISGDSSIFRLLLQIFSFIFFILMGKTILEKKIKLFIFIFITLGISNIRFVPPGKMFFEAFHEVIWFGLFVFSIVFLISQLKLNSFRKFTLSAPLLIMVIFTLLSKESIAKTNLTRLEEYDFNYRHYFIFGDAINKLSNENQTVFLEERDDLIYISADRNSSYKYQWYTSLMPQVHKYKAERDKMFINNPPDFYYDACLGILRDEMTPVGYIRVIQYEDPSCLLIKKDVFKNIEDSKWESVRHLGFTKK